MSSEEFRLNLSGSQAALPRFLRIHPNRASLSCRPHLPVDDKVDMGVELDARDIAHSRPWHRTRVYKKVQKKLAEAEELHNYSEVRGDRVDLETLEKVLNDLVS